MYRAMLKLTAVATAALLAGSALAEKPEWAGPGSKGRKERAAERSERARAAQFEQRHRIVVREYFSDIGRSGSCPPGLAKKRNGCMPPGQAKKWRMGQPLPREVVYYDIPPRLVIELGVPPAGYKYVRVAGDILMIAIGTAMVIDAIEDLGRI